MPLVRCHSWSLFTECGTAADLHAIRREHDQDQSPEEEALKQGEESARKGITFPI